MAPRELFLHVGMHKTGTTAFQEACFAGRDRLAAAGISYYDVEPNHSTELHGGFTEAPHGYEMLRLRGLHEAAAAAAFASAARARLAGFLRDAPGPQLLISGEDIGYLSAPAKAALLAACRAAVPRITVLGLVRPPRGYITASAGERIRAGGTLAVVEAGNEPHYRARFERFLQAPEVAEVRLRLYAPAALVGGDSVATLLHLMGAPPELARQLPQGPRNPAPSRAAALLLLAANEAVPMVRPDGRANPERATRLARLLARLEGPRFLLPEALLAPQLAAAEADVAWMEAQLGHPFPAEPAPESPVPGLGSLSRRELRPLLAAVNTLLRQAEGPGAGARGRRRQGDTTPGRWQAGDLRGNQGIKP